MQPEILIQCKITRLEFHAEGLVDHGIDYMLLIEQRGHVWPLLRFNFEGWQIPWIYREAHALAQTGTEYTILSFLYVFLEVQLQNMQLRRSPSNNILWWEMEDNQANLCSKLGLGVSNWPRFFSTLFKSKTQLAFLDQINSIFVFKSLFNHKHLRI